MEDFKWRNETAKNIFYNKYALTQADTWPERCRAVVDDVCGTMQGRRRRTLSEYDCGEIQHMMTRMKFMPGGRYLYYGGRKAHFFNNCFPLKAEEDTREEWAALSQRSISCLMVGGGIGIDHSIIRPAGRRISRTGGISSGALSLMEIINENGRRVMQGGARRSAIWAGLNWRHGDIEAFLESKQWDKIPVLGTGMTVGDLKRADFNYNAPLDMTNISVNYDDEFLLQDELPEVYIRNVLYALMNGEPGMSFNFGDKSLETLRNACCEITSEDDSDCCNLGAVNMAQIEDINEFRDTVHLGSKFLVCGSLRADLPYEKVAKVREQNRRIGLGLMGVHEWLMRRGYKYGMNEELAEWMSVYEEESERAANEHCDRFYLNRPKGYRAIAPTGTIGILAGTTTGIEPLYATAYKRRYLVDGTNWKYEYVIDTTAKGLIESGVEADSIETAIDLAMDYERRIAFQADMQDYIDHAISSTINLPEWGSEYNNEDTVKPFAETLRKYAPRLRGFTCYPDGGRGGQPITSVPYEEALKYEGQVFTESHDICDISGKGGTCGA